MIHPSAKVPIGSLEGKPVPMDQEWVRYLTVTLPAALDALTAALAALDARVAALEP